MSKKKEQVKFLKKNFAWVVKAFEKEKDKKKRDEAFEFLTGRIAEFRQCAKGTGEGKAELIAEEVSGALPSGGVQPSPALVNELRASHHTPQN